MNLQNQIKQTVQFTELTAVSKDETGSHNTYSRGFKYYSNP